jgi:general secretion pathway protein K
MSGSAEVPGVRGASGSRERGIALIAVLWGVALLAMLAGSFAQTARTETLIARNLGEGARAAAAAEAGVHRAIMALLDPVAGRRWRDDGHVYAFAFGGSEVRVSIQDEGGRIDLNAAPDELLRGLFRSVGLDDVQSAALAAAVADWRDEDDLPRAGGAEAGDYRAAGLGHGPRNRPFQAIEELRQVLGMSRPLYERLEPAITVHSQRASVNMATAPPQVLRSLPDMDDDKVRALLQERERVIAAAAAARPGGSEAGRSPARSRIGVHAIHAESRTAGGAAFSREVVVRMTGEPDEPYALLVWKRADGRLFPPSARANDPPERAGRGSPLEYPRPGEPSADLDVGRIGGRLAADRQPRHDPGRADAAGQVLDIDTGTIGTEAEVAGFEVGAGHDAAARRRDPDVAASHGGAADNLEAAAIAIAAGARDAHLQAFLDERAALSLEQEGVERGIATIPVVAFRGSGQARCQRGRVDLEPARIGDDVERHPVVVKEHDRHALELDAARRVVDGFADRRDVLGDDAENDVLRRLDEHVVGDDGADAVGLADDDPCGTDEPALAAARKTPRGREQAAVEASGR